MGEEEEVQQRCGDAHLFRMFFLLTHVSNLAPSVSESSQKGNIVNHPIEMAIRRVACLVFTS